MTTELEKISVTKRKNVKRKVDKQVVYEYLATIPKGKVVTYGQIAKFLGNSNLARTVGNILHENPDGDKYPCYKVVNAQGKLAENYAFGGLKFQKMRLEADGIIVNNDKVDLKKYQWNYEDDERLLRIIKMDRYFDELLAKNLRTRGLYSASKTLQNKLNALKSYYQNGLWLQDYESDERGELPRGLKRGILSQDALYNFLSDID
jgi:O-6-methylguanine DNA methyltransferase